MNSRCAPSVITRSKTSITRESELSRFFTMRNRGNSRLISSMNGSANMTGGASRAMSFEAGSRRERPAEDELARGKGLLSFDLSSHDLEGALTARDEHAVRIGGYDRSRCAFRPERREPGRENLEKPAADVRERPGPGRHAAPRVVNLLGRMAPIDSAVGFFQWASQGGERRILRDRWEFCAKGGWKVAANHVR